MCFFLQAATADAQSGRFPNAWVGHWAGTLSWYAKGASTPRLVPMTLSIDRADSAGFNWALKYGEADQRAYLLLPVDSTIGHWMIDERNGIRLDQFWMAGRLTGAFTVMNSTIINSYYLCGDSLIVEFNSISAKALQQSGLGTDESPSVQSYGILGYQRAVLYRKE